MFRILEELKSRLRVRYHERMSLQEAPREPFLGNGVKFILLLWFLYSDTELLVFCRWSGLSLFQGWWLFKGAVEAYIHTNRKDVMITLQLVLSTHSASAPFCTVHVIAVSTFWKKNSTTIWFVPSEYNTSIVPCWLLRSGFSEQTILLSILPVQQFTRLVTISSIVLAQSAKKTQCRLWAPSRVVNVFSSIYKYLLVSVVRFFLCSPSFMKCLADWTKGHHGQLLFRWKLSTRSVTRLRQTTKRGQLSESYDVVDSLHMFQLMQSRRSINFAAQFAEWICVCFHPWASQDFVKSTILSRMYQASFPKSGVGLKLTAPVAQIFRSTSESSGFW